VRAALVHSGADWSTAGGTAPAHIEHLRVLSACRGLHVYGSVHGTPIVEEGAGEVSNVRQLGSAVIAIVIMLASATFSEHLVPTVRSQEPARVSMIVADSVSTIPLRTTAVAELRPRVPEQLVMLVVGGMLIGLGGAVRTRRPDR
jgi:hypothetical protein